MPCSSSSSNRGNKTTNQNCGVQLHFRRKKESEIEMNECWSVHLHEAADDDGNGADDGCKKQNKSLRYVGGAGNQRWLHHHRHQHWPTQAPPNEVNATCFGAKETQIEEPGKHQYA